MVIVSTHELNEFLWLKIYIILFYVVYFLQERNVKTRDVSMDSNALLEIGKTIK